MNPELLSWRLDRGRQYPRSRRPFRLTLSLAVGLLLSAMMLPMGSSASLAGESSHHVPKPINIEVDVEQQKTEIHLLVDETLFKHWFSLEPKMIIDLEKSGEWGDYGDRVVEWLDLHAPVQVDGVQVIPVLDDLEYQEGFDLNDLLNYAAITVHYPTKAKPKQLDFYWSRFDTEDGFPLESVYYVLSAGDDYQVYRFREDSPGWTWNPPKGRRMVDPEQVAPGIRPPWFRLDWIPVVLSACGLYIVWKSKPITRFTVMAGAMCAFFAVISLGSSVVEVRPFWKSRVQLPDPDVAQALFETLHRNIYLAFDYEKEEQIYNLLDRSVSGELLPKLYDEIHESLLMRLEEVAVCDVRAVRILDSELLTATGSDEALFTMRAEWEVIGTVQHWGHGHWRKNFSRADYDVRWIPGTGWRITEVDVIEQRRLDDGKELVK